LDASQNKEAKRMVKNSEGTAHSRLTEAYRILVIPVQDDPRKKPGFTTRKLPSDPIQSIASKASQLLTEDDKLIKKYSEKHLLDDFNKWFFEEEKHIDLKTACEAYFRFIYFDRLKNPKVFENAVTEGVNLGYFGHAHSFEEGKYENPIIGEKLDSFHMDGHTTLIRKDVVERLLTEAAELNGSTPPGEGIKPDERDKPRDAQSDEGPVESIKLYKQIIIDTDVDPVRVRADFNELAEYVVIPLDSDPKSDVKIHLTIESKHSEGFDEKIITTLDENKNNISSIKDIEKY